MKCKKILPKAGNGEELCENGRETAPAAVSVFPAGLSRQDRAVWAQVAHNVRPLRRRGSRGKTALLHRDKTAPVAAASIAAIAAPGEQAGPVALRPGEPASENNAGAKTPLSGFERNLYRRLAQGRQTVDAKIDLHGHTQAQAHKALLHFVQQAQKCGFRHILIITGKGKTCQNGGILQKQVPYWLVTAPFRLYIAAIEQAAGRHGGEGAFYVRLHRSNTGPANKDQHGARRWRS